MRKFCISLMSLWLASLSFCLGGKPFKLENSVWYSQTPTEFNGEKGILINGFCFLDENRIHMKVCVVNDTSFITKPVLSGYGSYSYSGSLKKGVLVEIKTEECFLGAKIDYTGVITKDGMVLFGSDSTSNFYFPVVQQKEIR